MRIRFSPPARAELEDAIRFYELAMPGLGERFLSEIRRALHQIIRYPMAGPVVEGDIRKCLLARFPYKLLYSVETDYIYVIAVAHHHRKPGYWSKENNE